MSLSLLCESAAIHTIAIVASLLVTVSGNMDQTVSGDSTDHEHYPQTQTKPSEAVWTTDINMASDGSVDTSTWFQTGA